MSLKALGLSMKRSLVPGKAPRGGCCVPQHAPRCLARMGQDRGRQAPRRWEPSTKLYFLLSHYLISSTWNRACQRSPFQLVFVEKMDVEVFRSVCSSRLGKGAPTDVGIALRAMAGAQCKLFLLVQS